MIRPYTGSMASGMTLEIHGQSGIVFVRDIVKAQATKSIAAAGQRSGKGGQAQRRTPAAVELPSPSLDRHGESLQGGRA